MKTRGIRLGMALLVALIIATGVIGLLLFSNHEENRAIAQWREKLDLIADARAREVNSWFAAQSRDLGGAGGDIGQA